MDGVVRPLRVFVFYPSMNLRTWTVLLPGATKHVFQTEGTAVEWGRVVAEAERHGQKLSVLDSQIEATALHFGLTVVTRNGSDFFNAVVDPWQSASTK